MSCHPPCGNVRDQGTGHKSFLLQPKKDGEESEGTDRDPLDNPYRRSGTFQPSFRYRGVEKVGVGGRGGNRIQTRHCFCIPWAAL